MATARFWRENASMYNLIASKCKACGSMHFPPRAFCPECHRRSIGKIERFQLKGEGEIFSYSIVHEATPDLEMQKPYVLAMVRMDEGVMLTAQVVDCRMEDVRIGMRVRAVLRKLSEEGPDGVIHYGYKFVPSA
jgi:uncharacterized OB-fold protein